MGEGGRGLGALFLFAALSLPTAALGQDVSVFGRVYARMSADEREAFARQMSLQQARLGVKAKLTHLSATVEADLAARSMLKDAYLKIHDSAQQYAMYAGKLKAPFLQRELESSWDLPLVHRGLIDTYLTETQQLGGRRLGAVVELDKKDWARFETQLGLFRGAVNELGETLGEDVAWRVGVRPVKKLRLGAGAYVGNAFEKAARRYAGTFDATLKLWGARLTSELSMGRIALGPFVGASALFAWQFPVTQDEKILLEPVLAAEALQVQNNPLGQGYAGSIGMNLHYDDRFKVLAAFERALRPDEARVGNQLYLQLAARF